MGPNSRRVTLSLNIRNYIAQGARRRGLDPAAVLAVANVEGGFGGAVGDQGTSYGPFQLHVGGALPRGRGNAWANSPAGIEYALDQIAKVARGRKGRDAVAAIVSRFERPAAPGAEIQKAFSRYGKVGGGEAGAFAPSVPAAGQAPAPDKHLLAQQLISVLGQDHPDVGALIPLVAAAKAQPQIQQRMRAPTPRQPAAATSEHSAKTGINELFYDPLGGVKYGQQIGAIGGHKDHVHVSLASEAAQKRVLAQAKRMGLNVGQDTDANVTQVHVKDSFHYRHYRKGDPLREAADVSGDAKRMSAFYRWVLKTYG
jgi:hypothetical protein